jgi:hypothetical protein
VAAKGSAPPTCTQQRRIRPLCASERIQTRVKKGHTGGLIKLRARVPEKAKPATESNPHGYATLDFGGRVSKPSVKNFQMVRENDPDDATVMQFGRVSEDKFIVDFAWPLSPFQAFAIALSVVDLKKVGF